MPELTKTQSNASATSSNGSGSLLERRNTGKILTLSVDTSATDASLEEEDAAATSAAPTGTALASAETPAPYRDPPPTGSEDERYVPYKPSEEVPSDPPTPGMSGMDYSETGSEGEEE